MSVRHPEVRSAMQGAAWALLNALSARLINMVVMWLAARSLASSDYGALVLLQNSAQAWSLLLGAGISFTLSHAVATYRADFPAKVIGLVVSILLVTAVLAVGLGLIFFSFPELVSQHAFQGALMEGDLRLLGVWVVIWTLNTALVGALTGFEAFRINTVIALMGGATALGLVLAGRADSSAWVAGSMMAGHLVMLFGYFIALMRQFIRIKPVARPLIDKAHLGVLLTFGMPAFLGGVVISQSQWYANVSLSGAEDGLFNMAGFGIALQWYAVVLFIPGVIANSMLPVLSRHLKNPALRAVIFRNVLMFNIVVAVGVAVLAAILADPILRTYGDQYSTFAPVFRVMVLAAYVAASGALLLQDIASQGKGYRVLVINVSWALGLWGALLALPGRWQDPANIAFSYGIAAALQLLMILLYAKKKRAIDSSSSHYDR